MHWNVGNLLVVAGFVGLGASLWIPHATARRVAAVEARADQATRALVEATLAYRAVVATAVLPPTEVLQRATGFRVDAGSTASGDGGVRLYDDDYCYAVLPSPPSWPPNAPADTARPVEVYAWPRATLGPGRAAFFFATDATPVFTRNLRARYAGFERAPAAGDGRPRDPVAATAPAGEHSPTLTGYYDRNDERWLRLDA